MTREYGTPGDLSAIRCDPTSVVTVGTYDGVHLGHQAILAYLRERAALRGGPSTVVTFDPHPREVVRGEPVPLLTPIEERADLLEAYGVDRFVVLPFTREFAALSAEAYVRDVLASRVGLGEIVVGYDHAFGKGREGGRDLLERLGPELGFTVDVIPALEVDERIVSSTAVRALVEGGAVREAGELLGRPYALRGAVVRGDQRGRTIGFPTANLEPTHARKVIPARGVYAAFVSILDDEESATPTPKHPAMVNIGVRPTFGGEGTRTEAHLLDFDSDLYGLRLHVDFVAKLRDERRFDGIDALRRQLSDDAARSKRLLAKSSGVL